MSLHFPAQAADVRSHLNRNITAKAVVTTCIMAAFAAGVGVALLLRPKARAEASGRLSKHAQARPDGQYLM